MQIINLAIGAVIYLPFLRVLDKQYRASEEKTQDDASQIKEQQPIKA